MLNIGAHKTIKQTLLDLEAQANSNTMIMGDFNTLLSPIERSFRQKQQRNLRIRRHHDQADLIEIYKVFYLVSSSSSYQPMRLSPK
jgi:endonuclease/exonuclease/phosphatase family metal-dependent hydrolase